MDIILVPALKILITALELYTIIVFAYVILGWLTAFGVVNNYNKVVIIVGGVLSKLTEPILYYIRRVIPVVNGVDFSPIVLLLGVYFTQIMLGRVLLRFV